MVFAFIWPWSFANKCLADVNRGGKHTQKNKICCVLYCSKPAYSAPMLFSKRISKILSLAYSWTLIDKTSYIAFSGYDQLIHTHTSKPAFSVLCILIGIVLSVLFFCEINLILYIFFI